MAEPAQSRRERKEAHVTGLEGTTLTEVAALAALPVALLLLLRAVAAHLQRGPARAPLGPRTQLALEWLVFVPAQLVCQLDLISAPALLLALGLALRSLWALQPPRVSTQPPLPVVQQLRAALTLFRASLALITCSAILAVDFHAFPRRLGKVETYGSGLMDAGVGCFVLASAIPAGVAAAAAGWGLGAAQQLRPGRRRRELLHVGILLALGLGRALSTRSLDYQTHVGEYGVHWNFFLTLAAVRLASAALARPARSAAGAAVLGAGVLLIHQAALSLCGLIHYAHSPGPRTGWVSANKEGLLSLPGYLSLHWLGLAAGQLLQQAAAATDDAGAAGAPAAASGSKGAALSQGPAAKRLLAGVAGADGALWLACWAARRWVQPVSRRACNLPYVLWVLALGLQGVGLFLAAGSWRQGAVPLLLQRVNDAMLPVFLAANLLTGLVNMFMDTLAVGWWGALGVLLAYMAAVAAAAEGWAAGLHSLRRRRRAAG